MESVIGYTWEICMGDDIERCPSPEFGVFTDVMFSLNGRDMDKQGGQKKSRGAHKSHTPRVQIMLMLRITVLLQGGQSASHVRRRNL